MPYRIRHKITLIALVWIIVGVGNAYAQIVPGDYTSHEIDGPSVLVHTTTSSVRYTFFRSDMVRIQFLPSPGTEFDSSYTVIHDESIASPPNITQSDEWLELFGGEISVHIDKYPLRNSYITTAGTVTADDPDGGLVANQSARTVSLQLNPGEHLYGTGARGQNLDLRGYQFPCENQAHYGYSNPPDAMNVNVPLVLSSDGYALFIDNPWVGSFDLGFSDDNLLQYTSDGGELAVFIIGGHTIQNQLEAYTWLTGRQPLPTKWSLGYLQSKYGYHTQEEVQSVAQEFRTRGIPADGIIIDLYWFEHMGDYAWDYNAFPTPQQMIADLADDGFKTILITEPYFIQYCDHYGFLFSHPEYIGREANGDPYELDNWWSCGCDAYLLDVTDPQAANWQRGLYEDILDDGPAGFWTDLGEPERHPGDMHHTLGPRDQVHNLYNLFWAETVADAFASARPNERLFNLTRSGYAGIQRYGVTTWSGDVSRNWTGLATQLNLLLNTSLSGIAYNSSDLGGFTGNASPELYIRWMQFGAFNPIMRAHGFENHATEPWGFGDEAEQIVSEFIKLRYELMPYIYGLARENHLTGIPIVRPLFFADPDDPMLANASDAFLLGEDMLIVPIVNDGQRQTSIYLPHGEWIDFWTYQRYAGGTTVALEAPLDHIPVLVRNGSTLPMRSTQQYVNESPLDTLILYINPHPELSDLVTFYEDDGLTHNYQSGMYAETEISTHFEDGPGELMTFVIDAGIASGSYPGMLEQRMILAELHHSASPNEVRVNGSPVTEYASLELLLEAGIGYYRDGIARIVHVLAEKAADEALTVEVDMPVASVGESATYPSAWFISAAYPNPFNASTVLTVSLPQPSELTVTVFNIHGQQVASLADGTYAAGQVHLVFDAKGLASGIYFIHADVPGHLNTVQKVMLIR